MSKLTFGQIAVGLQFNPSGDPEVTKCKQMFADIIDQLNDLRDTSESEKQRRWCSVAITEVELAQMAAVISLTWKDPVEVPLNFKEEVIERSKEVPVLVDFYSKTCSPCTAIAPGLHKMAKEKKFDFVKIDTRVEQKLAEQFKVRGVPRLIIFSGGVALWDSADFEYPGVEGLKQKVAVVIDGLK